MLSRTFAQTLRVVLLSLFCVLFILLIQPTESAASGVLIDISWEKPNATWEDYDVQISRNNYGSEIVDRSIAPVCTGNKSVKHELIYGQGSAWSQLVLKKRGFESLEIGGKHWFSFAVYLPEGYDPDYSAGEVIWEMHGRSDGKLGEQSRNAPLSLRTQGTEWYVSYKKDTRQVNDKNYEESGREYIGSFETGKWTTFVVETLWDYKPNGYAKIWKDGQLVFHKTNGIGYNDEKGPFIKWGIYKSKWGGAEWSGPTDVSSRKIYIDDFRVGGPNATYEEMYPVCYGYSYKPPTGDVPPAGGGGGIPPTVFPPPSTPTDVNLTGSTPEQKITTVNVSKPTNTSTANITITVNDADRANEGVMWINNRSVRILFGRAASPANDGVTKDFSFSVPASSLYDGANSFIFKHRSGDGYTVEKVEVVFN